MMLLHYVGNDKTLFGMKENLEHFANSTTMHGASRVILSKSPLQRWIWLVVFLSAWTMFITQTWLVCQNYLTYPTKINVEINYGNVAFPAITLCNMRGLDFYAIHKLANHYERVWQNETVPVDQSDKFLTAFTRYVDYAQRKLDFSEDLDSDRIILSKTVLASNIRYDLLASKSISKEEFFVSCKFRGKDCEESSLAENYDHYYFRCFRYTPPSKGNLKEGAENGWSAIVLTGSGMLVNESQLIEGNFRYIPGLYEKNSPLSGSDGVRVVLHSPGVWPISVDEGFDVPPGYSVSLAFKPRVFVRADPPYGTCFHENPFYNGINMSSPEIQINKQIYREIECRKMCVQQRVIETCGCYEPSLLGLPLLHCEEYEADKNTNTFVSNCTYRRHLEDPRMIISICGYAGDVRCPAGRDCEGEVFRKQLNETSCVRSVKEDDISPEECTCSPPCNEVEYDVGYSFSKWPAKGSDADEVLHEILVEQNYSNRFIADTDKYKFYNYYVDVSGKQILNDFARINVFVADRKIVKTVETPLYTFSQLISDVGGQLGIWIGVSVITVTEVLELIVATLGECVRRKKITNSSQMTEDDKLETVRLEHFQEDATR